MKTRLVIFDLDGTLIDAYPAVEETLNDTLKTFGIGPVSSDVIRRTVGWGDRHLVETFVGKERIDAAIKIYRAHHAEALLRGSYLLPGALGVLDSLRRNGYHLAVASNRPKAYAMIVMKHLEIDAFFDYILCGDELPRPKPDPDILLKILERFQCDAEEALFVGDMVIDVATGHAAGIRTAVSATGSSSAEELRASGPWRMMDTVTDVLKILNLDTLSADQGMGTADCSERCV